LYHYERKNKVTSYIHGRFFLPRSLYCPDIILSFERSLVEDLEMNRTRWTRPKINCRININKRHVVMAKKICSHFGWYTFPVIQIFYACVALLHCCCMAKRGGGVNNSFFMRKC